MPLSQYWGELFQFILLVQMEISSLTVYEGIVLMKIKLFIVVIAIFGTYA